LLFFKFNYIRTGERNWTPSKGRHRAPRAGRELAGLPRQRPPPAGHHIPLRAAGGSAHAAILLLPRRRGRRGRRPSPCCVECWAKTLCWSYFFGRGELENVCTILNDLLNGVRTAKRSAPRIRLLFFPQQPGTQAPGPHAFSEQRFIHIPSWMSPMSIPEMISKDETLPAAGVAHAHCGADDARPPDPPDPGPCVA